jgi:hypothetical protein
MEDFAFDKLIRRIKAKNGMVVNAEVWQEAHDFHRLHLQAHSLYAHGAGILTGLEVKADEDPTSRRVWIKPGIGVDPQGVVVVLDEQVSYTIKSDQEGMVYLLLDGQEGQLPISNDEASRKAPDYVQDGYLFNSVLELPDNAVELARFRLVGRGAEIRDAQNPDVPVQSEIDLRFRRAVGLQPPAPVGVGIIYLGETNEDSLPPYEHKAGHLARALSHLVGFNVWIDDGIAVEDELSPYTMLYLIEQGPNAVLNDSHQEILRAFVQEGGTLFIESYAAVKGDTIFRKLLPAIGIKLRKLNEPDHPLLINPFMFAALPEGVTSERAGFVGEGAILSTSSYGRLWQRDANSSREAIRTALEWGANVVTYAAKRRRAMNLSP